MFALIFENKVVEIYDDKFPVAKSLKWIACNASVKVGWFYINEEFRQSLGSDLDILEEAKSKKISQIKSVRDQKNTEPLINHQAFIIDANGNVTAEESDFLFYTNRHQSNPTSDPVSIISRVLELGAMPYFTKDNVGNKVVVELTPTIASALHQSIATRNDSNYRICFATEAAIRNAATVEEVEAITWNENI